jgi:hypothetical protein
MAEPDSIAWIRKNWVILTFIGSLIVGWTTLKYDSEAHAEKLREHDASLKACHDFMTAQNEINKKIDKFDDKLDRLLRRQSRGASTDIP